MDKTIIKKDFITGKKKIVLKINSMTIDNAKPQGCMKKLK